MDSARTSSNRNGIEEEIFSIDSWIITTRRSHILNSKCVSPAVCGKTREKYGAAKPPTTPTTDQSSSAASPTTTTVHSPLIGSCAHETPRKTWAQVVQLKRELYHTTQLCDFCKFDLILEMAHFPDMTYAANVLQLRHRPSGLVLEFNVFDSLVPIIVKCIGLPAGMKVSPSEAWLKARLDCEYTRNVMNANFDWTFSSDYRGTFRLAPEEVKDTRSVADSQLLDLDEATTPVAELIAHNSEERINIEKLKIQKQILFYEEVDLFEDELADHGVAKCNAKIRVMPDSFFILLRFFLRVDNVFVRFYDTRLYHEFDKSYIIRECTNHEAAIPELALKEDQASFLLINPAELYNHVPEQSATIEKIALPREAIKMSSTV